MKIRNRTLTGLVALALTCQAFAATYPGKFIDTEKPQVAIPNSITPKTQGLLTLREAILLALRHNLDVQNSELDRISAKYNFNLVENAYHWQYGVSANAGWTRSKINDVRLNDSSHLIVTPTAKRGLRTGGEIDLQVDQERDAFDFHPRAKLSISQPLLRGLQREVRFKAHLDALDQDAISQMQLKSQVANTVLEVMRAYRSLILANNNLITAQQSLDEMQDTLNKNAKQIELGTLPSTTNIGVEAQLASLNLRMLETRNDVNEAKQTLLQAIGLSPNSNISVPNDVQITDEPLPNPEQAINTAFLQNLEFQQTLLSMKQHQRDLIKAKDDQRWQLDLSASASVGGGGAFRSRRDLHLNDLVNGKTHSEDLSLNLHIPVNDYANKASLKLAKLQIERDQNSLLKARQNLEREIGNDIIHLKFLSDQVRIAKQSVALERKNYELQVKKQALGKGTSMEVTTSQNTLIQSRVGYITAKVAYLNARAELDNKIGDLVDKWDIQIRY